jgi:uncharacterized protein with HEPN domain
MTKDDLTFIAHMIDVAGSAAQKCSKITKEQFDVDENLRLAVTHLVQTMGEAARKISAEFRQKHSYIPWTQIVGMRHKVVHDYMHVDYDLVWDVATLELPRLLVQLKKLAGDDDGRP